LCLIKRHTTKAYEGGAIVPHTSVLNGVELSALGPDRFIHGNHGTGGRMESTADMEERTKRRIPASAGKITPVFHLLA